MPIANLSLSFPPWSPTIGKRTSPRVIIKPGGAIVLLAVAAVVGFVIYRLAAGPSVSSDPVNSLPVNLDADYNVDVFSHDSNMKDGDADKLGATYSADLVGHSAVSASGVTFHLGPFDDGKANAVKGTSQTIALPAGKYSSLRLLAFATNLDKQGTFIFHYKDNDDIRINVGFTDWCAAAPTFGEVMANNLAYRNTRAGTKEMKVNHMFAYTVPLLPDKTLTGVTLPNNEDIKILAAALAH